MLDGNRQPFDQPRFGIELPFIHPAPNPGFAGVLVGHAHQPFALIGFGPRLRWLPQAKRIDVFKGLPEPPHQHIADAAHPFDVGRKRDGPGAHHHVQDCLGNKRPAEQMRAVAVLGEYVVLNRELSSVHGFSVDSLSSNA